jgi:hypothetical protein
MLEHGGKRPWVEAYRHFAQIRIGFPASPSPVKSSCPCSPVVQGIHDSRPFMLHNGRVCRLRRWRGTLVRGRTPRGRRRPCSRTIASPRQSTPSSPSCHGERGIEGRRVIHDDVD